MYSSISGGKCWFKARQRNVLPSISHILMLHFNPFTSVQARDETRQTTICFLFIAGGIRCSCWRFLMCYCGNRIVDSMKGDGDALGGGLLCRTLGRFKGLDLLTHKIEHWTKRWDAGNENGNILLYAWSDGQCIHPTHGKDTYIARVALSTLSSMQTCQSRI